MPCALGSMHGDWKLLRVPIEFNTRIELLLFGMLYRSRHSCKKYNLDTDAKYWNWEAIFEKMPLILPHQKPSITFLIEIVRKWCWHHWKGKILSFPLTQISVSTDFYWTNYGRFLVISSFGTFVGWTLKKCLELWNFETLKPV